MKDLFQNYHKHKVLSNVWILSIAALLAVSVNMFLFSGNTGEMIKANVLEATVNQASKIDFSAEISNDAIVFRNSQEMQDVKEFSFSLAYNFEILELWGYSSSLGENNISLIENNDGFSSYIMTFVNPINIPENTQIIDLNYIKMLEQTVHLNIINVNFTDNSEEKYLLRTQWIIF
jgi:hypothetical protein